MSELKLVVQPLHVNNADLDLRNDEDLKYAVITAAKSLIEDKDLSAVAFVQQSGPRDLMLFTTKDGDIGRLADSFDFREVLEDIITMLRKGNRVIVVKVDGKEGWHISRVAGDYDRAFTIDGTTLDKYTPRPNLNIVPHCGHYPTEYAVVEIIRCDDGPNKAGEPVCTLCAECGKVYGSGAPEERALAERIGEDALVPCFMFVPIEDIKNLPSAEHITVGAA